ncbi:MAG: hypothetical protein DRI90_23740 [Deltaproteobacteria bacterium]|nr:MAG: hypothetical protein DRI90_23740 [Deltaproteobacteria bacterium]
MSRNAVCLGLVTVALATLGCGSDVADQRYGIVDATLSRAEDCGQLLLMLKQDQLGKMNGQIDASIEVVRRLSELEDNRYGDDDDMAMGTSSSSGEAAPPQDFGTGGASGGEEPPDHSETNTQVAGVDEADIVKTDGTYLYILHGQTLAIVQSWPVLDLGLANTIEIEGQPIEMFLADDEVADTRVVIYSTVSGTEIYQTAGVTPPAPAYNAGYPETGWEGADYPADSVVEHPLTKVTVLDLDGIETAVAAEYYFEGSYQSSRRVGRHVRTVLNAGQRPGPAIQTTVGNDYYGGYYYDQDTDYDELISKLESLRFDNTIAISAAKLADYIPTQFVKDGNQVEALAPQCDSYYVPTAGSTDYGMSQVQAFDLDALADGLVQVFVVGDTQAIYSNAESLYLAGRVWRHPMMSLQDSIANETLTGTHLHKFDLASDPAEPRYVASGTVAGEIHNQFSMDELDGTLRIATTEWSSADGWGSPSNNLFVLEAQGSALTEVGAVRELAPSEEIYAVRFVGDRGYIVTFRQVDPLFVIDLSTPESPTVLGDLHIPGFSEYMHPINDGQHLLTIGQDGIGSVALQIFDVTDPMTPTLTHKEVLTSGTSEAEYNHKAFTFYQGRLAIPLSGYDNGSWVATLALFDIDVDAGITLLGTIDHSPLFGNLDSTGYCYPYGVGVRRGVFIDEYIYSIPNGGVLANDLNNQLELVASTPLPDLPDAASCY